MKDWQEELGRIVETAIDWKKSRAELAYFVQEEVASLLDQQEKKHREEIESLRMDEGRPVKDKFNTGWSECAKTLNHKIDLLEEK